MTLFRLSATRRLLNSLSRVIIPQFLRLVRWSWRGAHRQVHPQTQVLLEAGKPVIYALWHGRMFVILAGFPQAEPTILISQSRDGEFITRVAKGLGFRRFVRGGHRRGGAMAARAMTRELTESGRSLLILADGPRGPCYEMKKGLVKVAAQSQVPIIPVAGSAGLLLKVLRRSWDQYQAPFFFSPMTVMFGAPVWVDGRAATDDGVLADECRRAETALRALTDQADRSYPRAVELIP